MLYTWKCVAVCWLSLPNLLVISFNLKKRRALYGVLLFFIFSPVIWAKQILVQPGQGSLAEAIAMADEGDELLLKAGHYFGRVVIDKTLTLQGEGEAIIDGEGEGRVITVAAENSQILGLTVVNSGDRLSVEDSGIYITKAGAGALVAGNRLEKNLIGIYLKGSKNVVVRDNLIIGSDNRHVNERGNGVQIWNAPGSLIESNTIRQGRDGIFVTTSHHNIFRNNDIQGVRYAIHYMYTNSSEVAGNLSKNNKIGYALMFSDRLNVHDNRSVNDKERGLLLNFVNGSTIERNRVEQCAGKCLFFYNANRNTFMDNYFEGCSIGIHFTAGSEKNKISGNAFVNNKTQVKYVGTRHIEWSYQQRGNYWSDNMSFDLNNDGIADQPYKPNDLVDQILWAHPLAKLLLNSPALQVMRWAQSAFPGLHPGGIKDSAPLMRIPLWMEEAHG
ncbi:MAG: nitrous oxide reductase family maturation protein NosD [Gammaproteobacteria bacterium]|nr:MAG: nitrous oxide reductase family maturation protein NosD [Gammaproteobacteria bacterium]